MKQTIANKQSNKQQWILCAALLMALGSQSYYQVSSSELSSVDLASLTPTPEAPADELQMQKALDETVAGSIKESEAQALKKAEAQMEAQILEKRKSEKDVSDDVKLFEFYKSYELVRMKEAKASKTAEEKAVKLKQASAARAKADQFAKKTSALKASAAKPTAKVKAVARVTTEAKAAKTESCEGGCDPADSTEKIVAQVLKIMEQTEKEKAAKEQAVVTEVPKNETAKERRERLAALKQEAKEAKEEEKRLKQEEKRAEKLEQKTERNERFAEKMEDVGEKCQENIECKTTAMTSLLSNYTGEKKIDAAVVNKAFNQYISKDLRAALSNRENTPEVAEAIYQLNAEIPNEYRFLKIKTIDAVKNESILRASEINRNYQMASHLTNANKPLEAEQYWRSANASANLFAYDYRVLRSSIVGGLDSSEDRATLTYVNSDYVPNMEKLMTSLMNPAGIEAAKTNPAPTTTTSRSASARSSEISSEAAASTRNARSGNRTSNTVNKIGNADSSTVDFGSPNSSPRGNRRSN